MRLLTVRLDETQINSVLTVLEHSRNNALGTATSNYGIDALCRKDCAARWWDIITTLRAALPKAELTKVKK